ncbi:MAG: hypothetical protein K2Q25_11625 [Mycobacteriaceae bacterium]|nr:hypothetical protein [Mycobacteriaceae bacterium]
MVGPAAPITVQGGRIADSKPVTGDPLPVEGGDFYGWPIILTALACFQGLYALELDAGGASPTECSEYGASTMLNLTADIAAIAAILARANGFLEIAESTAPLVAKTPYCYNATGHGQRILGCLTAVEFFAVLTGFGEPYKGHDFYEGSQLLAVVSDQLNAVAELDESKWSGAAAESCSATGATLKDYAQDLSSWDKNMAAAAENHAQIVLHTRTAFGILKTLLLLGFAYEEWFFLKSDFYQADLIDEQVSLWGSYALVVILFTLPCGMSRYYADYAFKVSHRYLRVQSELEDGAWSGAQDRCPQAATGVSVSTRYLRGLATSVNSTAEQIDRAKHATAYVTAETERHWGSLFRAPNDGFDAASRKRRAALKALGARCDRLHTNLDHASADYAETDTLWGKNVGKQVLDW